VRHIAQQVHPDAHVWGEHDGDVSRRFFDPRALRVVQAGDADDVGLSVGEVGDDRIRGGELYENSSVFGRLFGGGDVCLSPSTQLAEV